MSGESTPWVDGLTFDDVLTRTAREYGDRDAVVFPRLELRWSYGEFRDRVHEMARALMGIGIGRGDSVGIWCTNWPQWVLAQFGTAVMGAVLVNVNPAYRKHELAYILKQADLQALIITDTHKTSNYEAMVAEVVPEVRDTPCGAYLHCADYPKLQHVISICGEAGEQGIWSWPAFLDQAMEVGEPDLDEFRKQIKAQDPVNIQYTSGTTGDPKGATLSHRNLLMNAYYVGQRMSISDADRVCIPVPFYHCFGCVIGTLLCTVYGSALRCPAAPNPPCRRAPRESRPSCSG